MEIKHHRALSKKKLSGRAVPEFDRIVHGQIRIQRFLCQYLPQKLSILKESLFDLLLGNSRPIRLTGILDSGTLIRTKIEVAIDTENFAAQLFRT